MSSCNWVEDECQLEQLNVVCEDNEGDLDTLTTAPLSSPYHSSPGRVGSPELRVLHELLDDLEATQAQTTMGGEVVHNTSVDNEEAFLHGSSNPEGDVLLTENHLKHRDQVNQPSLIALL